MDVLASERGRNQDVGMHVCGDGNPYECLSFNEFVCLQIPLVSAAMGTATPNRRQASLQVPGLRGPWR